jgi:hypothetical protein
MVFSEALLRYPYTLLWHLVRSLSKPAPVVAYCAEVMDWQSLAPVLKHLAPVPVVTTNPGVKRYLREKGIACHGLPSFPRAVIMCRHATHRFPCSGIIKIGLRHGPYHFKRMTKAANYNRFDLYLFSSVADLKAAEAIGVRVGKAVGFPRLDPAFDGTITPGQLEELKRGRKLDPGKPVLLFTATWDRSGMSGIGHWYDKLEQLANSYNVVVTVHPWTAEAYVERIKATRGVGFLEEADLLPWLMLADICIGDTSSLLAECSALSKPIVTFRTPTARRSLDEIELILKDISLQVESFGELIKALETLISEPGLLREGQARANQTMFDILDGKASLRAAKEIIKLIPELKR